MALQKKQSKSSKIIGWSIGILIVAAAGYFAYTRFYLGRLGNTNNQGVINNHSVITNFGESILQDDRFTKLQDYSQSVNADINSAGQSEPFQ